MSLHLIVGPPNSGRAGAILAGLRDALPAEPVLIVPGGDDVARFERDLTAGGEPAIGASIRTFDSLAGEIAAAAPPLLSDAQRLALVRAATGATNLRLLARSSRSSGFPGALDALIGELQAALITPRDLELAVGAAGDRGAVGELAALYASYRELRDRAGRADGGSLAAAAANVVRTGPGEWASRPVFVYGFDDLTESQLELVRLLSRATSVTVAVNYADRRALSARASLLSRLRDEGEHTEESLGFDPRHTASPALRHLDRELFEPEAEAVEQDDGLFLLECAGLRGEAEAVGLEIARLLAAGADPGAIVVALRRPTGDGPLFASVLRSMDIPVALEAELPLAATAVGRALTTLCEAVTDGSPAALLAHLRANPAFPPGGADGVEARLERGEIDTLESVWEGWESPPRHLERVRAAGDGAGRLLALAACARELAELPHRERAPLAGERTNGTPFDPIEARAGIAAAELLTELAAAGRLPGCEPAGLPEAAEAIAAAGVRAWRGSTEGRVRIASPYRLRGARADHLFCCAMNEGVFPSRSPADPLLGEAARAELGIGALRRAEQADEERYLFHACVSRPAKRLCLSWQASDDDGRPAPRSPFVDEVLDLVAPPAGSEEHPIRVRGLAAVVPAPAQAPTPRLLARGLALAGGAELDSHRDALARLGVDVAASGEALALLAATPAPGWQPGPLRHPLVLAELAARHRLSASSLENWVSCSYRWFVDHELNPNRLEPTADPLWRGGVVHRALERLYAEAPSGGRPTTGDLPRWQARFGELADEEAAGPEGAPLPPARALVLARAKTQVAAFLADQAANPTSVVPAMFERSFGYPDEEGDPGALPLGGDFSLYGRIDRIDVEPATGKAVVHDYKMSKSVASAKDMAEKGADLQLRLYMLVARDRLELDLIGGLYHPIAAASTGQRRARGLVLAGEEFGDQLGEKMPVGGDTLGAGDFKKLLQAAHDTATREGARMRAGDIGRDPHEGECPHYCSFQPICRLERAAGHDESDAR